MVKVRVRVFKSIARSSRARQCARISRLYLKTILLTELMILYQTTPATFPLDDDGYKRVHMRSVKRHRGSL